MLMWILKIQDISTATGGAQQLGLQNYRHMYRVPAKDPVGGDSVFLFLNKDDVIVFLDM